MTAIILTCKKRRRNYELQLQPIIQKAEEFINHEEILETLSYAEKNKNNVELIDQILAKAWLRKG